MGQHVIIVILFLAALFYIGYILYKSFLPAGCSSGCNSCGIDFGKIEKELQKERKNKQVKR